MQTDFFHLKIIPIKDIHCHEEYDASRSGPLVENLKKEKVLANPILVASLSDDKYLQLDGMNRLSSFKMLGLDSIAVQIIDYNDQEDVELSSWAHLFPMDGKIWQEKLSQISDLVIKPGTTEHVGYRYVKEEGMGRICTVLGKNGRKVDFVSSNGDVIAKVGKLCEIVSIYKDNIIRDVLPSHCTWSGLERLFEEHTGTNFMIVFPTFTRHQIVDIVQKGVLLPAGITRHIIKRRCLSVNIPLSIFESKNSIKQKNEELEKMLSKRKFRVYEEPTIFFE